MFNELHFHDAPSGARLAYHHLPAEGMPRAIIVICHGLAEHSRRYGDFASALSAAGLHVYAHDHRGHGETTAPDAPIGRYATSEGAAKVVADVRAMRDFAVSRHPGLPVILFGHSMGGLISLNAVTDHPDAFQAVSIWNSNFNPGIAGRIAQLVLKLERIYKGSDVPSLILPLATFGAWGKAIPNHRTAFDWLSHDAAEVDAYIADPLCGFDASVSLWQDLFTLTFRGTSDRQLARLHKSTPVYLVGGGEDPATNKGREIRWLATRLSGSGMRNVTTRIYDTMRHETLNEVGREAPIADFLAWCEHVLADLKRAPAATSLARPSPLGRLAETE
ncbi:alpha/beta hydrolase fold containing protein [Rhizobium sp. PDO1-076]|uniref:alpha/beta hydrolase n=1 Tax=Rhizobium sp. PDO1-076 TaxID=1125979 RepID=UPI00024E2229|nr:alpha/beta hydrolase [Rhizobium sp. PDO1-076]EHS50553.1 alpha/beta hydrolase fold containing protein [Rhizobium sp. PDO1-076]